MQIVAAIFEVPNSNWLLSFNQNEIVGCKHFQIMFYDEIYDVVCKSVITGKGNLAFQRRTCSNDFISRPRA